MSWLPSANSYTSVVNPLWDRSNAASSLYSHYNYVPNRGFNIFAAVVWGLVFFAHLYWLVARQRRVAETGFVAKGRTRSIQSLFLLGSALEFVVYVIRSVSHSKPFHARLFQAQYVINLFTPLLFVMAMQLGLLKALAQPREHHLLAFNRPKPIIQTFLALSAIALILNLIGSAIWSVAVHTLLRGLSTNLSARAGRNVLTAGQAIEITTITLTLALLTWALLKYFQSKKHTVYYINKLFLLVLYLTLGMLFTRAIYRLVETRQGWWGRAWSSEALYGVFEFATVWTAVTIWAAWPMRNTLDSVRDDHSIPITNKRVSNDTVLTHSTAVNNGPAVTTTNAHANTIPAGTGTLGHNGVVGHNGTLGHGTVGHNTTGQTVTV